MPSPDVTNRPGCQRTWRRPATAGTSSANSAVGSLSERSTSVPLAITLTGGHRNEVTQLIPLIDAVPPIRVVVGKPRRHHAGS